MSLKNVLDRSSLAQESILSSRLLYDLRIAAAHADYFLQSFRPDPDIEGFDVILDDGEKFRKVQLKSVRVDATTDRWKVHLRHLKPDPGTAKRLAMAQIPPWTGVLGGIILIEYHAQAGSIDVSYLYTDFLVIAAIRLGLLKSKGTREQKLAENLWHRLRAISSDKHVWVSRSLFVSALDPMHLLALMGLNSRRPYTWETDLLTYIEVESGRQTDPKDTAQTESYKKNVAEKIENGV